MLNRARGIVLLPIGGHSDATLPTSRKQLKAMSRLQDGRYFVDGTHR